MPLVPNHHDLINISGPSNLCKVDLTPGPPPPISLAVLWRGHGSVGGLSEWATVGWWLWFQIRIWEPHVEIPLCAMGASWVALGESHFLSQTCHVGFLWWQSREEKEGYKPFWVPIREKGGVWIQTINKINKCVSVQGRGSVVTLGKASGEVTLRGQGIMGCPESMAGGGGNAMLSLEGALVGKVGCWLSSWVLQQWTLSLCRNPGVASNWERLETGPRGMMLSLRACYQKVRVLCIHIWINTHKIELLIGRGGGGQSLNGILVCVIKLFRAV